MGNRKLFVLSAFLMSIKDFRSIPKDGFAGFKQNFRSDASAGFVVFLLAMPLSLGIAKASGFPAIMGLVTAILGGLVVSFFAGSKLTIKGPAAGLIVVVASSVSDFGGGIAGWQLALGAMVVAGLIQILFGVFKLGGLVDIFPLSVIHGMLAAIGLIIIIKHIPILLAVDPSLYQDLSIFGMLGAVPNFISNLDPQSTFIGFGSLAILLGWPFLPTGMLKKIPAPLVVLLVAIAAAYFLDFSTDEASYALLEVGSLRDNLKFNASFDGFAQTGLFTKYVIMFALVGTLESLLTVKAIDLIDPFKRKSNPNKDLIAVGIGNAFAGFLGGLPMISEVARSSANVTNGAKTRWANFFHGFFILVFVLVAAPLIEMIPNAALAAMLIVVGIKLAHPKEFVDTYKIGTEQFAIFLMTIVVTLLEDLLIGIAAGILLKVIFHLYYGVSISSFFKVPMKVSERAGVHTIQLEKAAIFSNFLPVKAALERIPQRKEIVVDFSQSRLVDHSVMENLHLFQLKYEESGGSMNVIGLEKHKPFSNHPLAGRKI